jgi:hypothetical protein
VTNEPPDPPIITPKEGPDTHRELSRPDRFLIFNRLMLAINAEVPAPASPQVNNNSLVYELLAGISQPRWKLLAQRIHIEHSIT